MIKESKVVSVVTEIKSEIRKELQRKNYEDVLGLISICAKLLYSTNICYRDDFLEASLKEVSDAIDSYSYTLQDIESAEKDVVMFYDGFGLNERGLAQIYIKALCKFKKVIYVTFEDRKTLIPDIQNILNNHDAKSIYLNRRKLSNIALVEELSKVISEYSPKSFVYYSVPEDVIATTVLYAFEGKIRRYQINLTDHAFWLGAGCIDYCIEFRNYGASISNEYRCIEREKIVVIPFYPIVDRTRKFDGFPFALNEGQKVFFSGGALYKTLGDGNKYYEIVRRLLESNKDLVFWYAGNGKDTELRKILCDYPCRAFHTNERADLLQIMENSCFYLSTYPLSGGLMFQYAASGGCVPLTLRSPYMPTEFLCNQNSLDLEFDSIEDLILEAQKLLSDDKYAIMRGEQVKKAVMSQEEFESNVMNLIDDRIDSLQAPSFDHQDTKKFRDWYLDDMTVNDINALLVKKKDWRLGISHYPLRFIKGGVYILYRRLL